MEKKQIKNIEPNPKKQLLVCGQVVNFDKQGKVKERKWTYEILES